MRHLTESDLLDLAEGAEPEASAGHLASCEACRRQLMDLRAALTAAAAVDVPEPSPLFWEHLSARVHEAVQAEGQSSAPWLSWWPSWRAIVPIGALAMLALAAALMVRPAHESSIAANVAAGTEITDTAADAGDLAQMADDPSLTLLGDLTSDLDWDGASEAGLAPGTDAVDEVVTSLSSGERRELHRLLQEALRETPQGQKS
jgi:predicted anti-sigma-YlaC factor YlaD